LKKADKTQPPSLCLRSSLCLRCLRRPCVFEDRFRITDAEAKRIIKEVSGAESTTEFLSLSVLDRNVFIKKLKERGLSIRQISRVTGVSKGIVERS
jgi:putative transposase